MLFLSYLSQNNFCQFLLPRDRLCTLTPKHSSVATEQKTFTNIITFDTSNQD